MPQQITVTLPENDSLFRLLVENNQDYAIIMLDPNGYIISWNAGAENIKGYKAEEIIGQHFGCFFAKTDISSIQPEKKLEIAISQGRFEEESWRLRQDGSQFFAHSIITPIRNNGQLLGFSKIIRDITDHKQTETALRQNMQMLDLASDAIVIRDMNDQIIYWNYGAETLYGWKKEEVLGKCIQAFLHPNFYNLPQELLNNIKDSGQWEGELKQINRDGKQIIVASRWTLQRDESGQPIAILEINNDITKRRQIEEELKFSEQKLSFIFNQASLALIEWDLNLKVTQWNLAAETIFGYSAAEAIGRHPAELIVPENVRPIVNKILEDLFLQTGVIHNINENVTKDGRTIICDWYNTPLIDENNRCIGVASLVTDITERKRTEAALIESNNLLNAVIENTPNIIFAKDLQGRYVLINSTLSRFLGKSKQEIIGKNAIEILDSESSRKINEKEFQIMATGISETGEDVVQYEGRAQTFLTVKSPWLDDRENIIGLIAIAHNISDRKQAQKEQARLVAILEATPDLVGIADAEGRLIYMNKAGRKMLGIDEGDDITRNYIFEFRPQLEAKKLRNEILPVVISEGIWRGESSLLNRNDTLIAVSQVLMAHKSENGKIEFISTIATDITERKRIEEERQKLVSIVESSSDFIGYTSVEGKPIYLNSAGQKLIGLSSIDEGEKMELMDFFMPEDHEILQNHIFPTVMQRGYWQGEFRFKHWQTGLPIPIDYSSFLLKDAQTSQPVGLATITRDISDRKQAEEALRQSQTQLQLALNAAKMGVWEWNIETGELKFSEQAELLFGFTPGSFLGTIEAFVNTIHPEDKDFMSSTIAQLMETGSSYDGEYRVIWPDGTVRWIAGKGDFLRDDTGNAIWMTGIFLDINDRKLTEAAIRQSETQLREKAIELQQTLIELRQTQAQVVQSEKMSSLGQLVAGVAHEINNPVNFIYGNIAHAGDYTQDLIRLIELYKKHYPTPNPEIEDEIEAIDLDFLLSDLPKLLTSMKVGADRIQKIVLSLRNFSRMDEAEMKDVDIHEGIDSTLMILQNRIKAKPDHPGIEVIKEYGKLPLVECYAGQLNQVFMNILTNAFDALDDHLSQLTLQKQRPAIVIKTLSNSTSVIIRIIDNGPGIPDEVQKRLFDPFFTTKEVGKGTGLGLSISYQIVTEKHGGKLECISNPGEGTEFAIEIPIKQS